MQILVCFQPIKDASKLSTHDWETALEPSFSFLPWMLHPSDETALAAVLHLKEQRQAQYRKIHCHALAIGDSSCDVFLRRLGALGYDMLTCLEAYQDIAYHIVQYMKQYPVDVIVTGYHDDGILGCILAEKLQWSLLSYGVDLQTSVQEDALSVTILQEARKLSTIAAKPLVVSMKTMGEHDRLPIATLRQMDQAKHMPIEVVACMEKHYQTEAKGEICWSEQRHKILLDADVSIEEKQQRLWQELYIKEEKR